jgi:arylsulfatase A-like enzyme
MAEIFSEHGYATCGLPAMSLLDSKRGFSRGFDEYDIGGLQSDPHMLGHRYLRSNRETLFRLFKWLDLERRPFLAWVHHFGIHKVEADLLYLPEEYRHSYSEYAQFYDSKVSYTDASFVSPLVKGLAERDLLDKTILVFWSDHGEDLQAQERGLHWGHNNGLEECVVRILLSLRIPGQTVVCSRWDDRLCGSIDVLPTLLALTGIDCPCEVEGSSLLQSNPESERNWVYFENLCQGVVGVRFDDYKFVLSLLDQAGDRSGERPFREKLDCRFRLLSDTFWQLLPDRWRWDRTDTHAQRDPDPSDELAELEPWWRARGEPEQVLLQLLERGQSALYDLGQYPAESVNLADALPDVVSRGKALVRAVGGLGEDKQGESVLSADEEGILAKRLEGLGYL